MKKYKWAVGSAVGTAIAIIVVVSCIRGGSSGEPHYIGVSLPLTTDGEPNKEGVAMRNSLNLFVDKINERGASTTIPLR